MNDENSQAPTNVSGDGGSNGAYISGPESQQLTDAEEHAGTPDAVLSEASPEANPHAVTPSETNEGTELSSFNALSNFRSTLTRFAKNLPFNKAEAAETQTWNKRRLFITLTITLLLGYAIVEPIVQPAIVATYRYTPAIIAAIIGLSITILMASKTKTKDGVILDAITGGVAVMLCLLFVYTNTAQWVVQAQMSATMRPQVLTELPVSKNLRMLPRVTAYEYSRNASNDTRLGVESTNPVLTQECIGESDCKLLWQSALKFKKGISNLPAVLFGSIARVVRIDASQGGMHVDGDESGDNAKFLFGGKSWVANLLFRWAHPLSYPGELVYFQKTDGQWVMLISYISYRPTWTGTMVPRLAGVMEFNRYGWFSNHSPKESAQLYPGTVLFPPRLGRAFAIAYGKWHSGLMNVLVDHYGIDELSEDWNDVSKNEMPYVQSFDQLGLVEVAALEPIGDQNFALSGLLFFDAVTGKSYIWKPGAKDSINGPRRAEVNVVAGEPEINWKNYHLVEPRVLVSAKHELYYLFTMVQDDGNNHAVAKFFLEKASSLKTIPFNNGEQNRIQEFLKTELLSSAVGSDVQPNWASPASR